MSINDGYTKSATFLQTISKHQPSLPAYLTTSQEIKDNEDKVHIIPVDDDESIYESLDKESVAFPIDDEEESINSIISTEDEASAASDDEANDEMVAVPQNEVDKMAQSLQNVMSDE